MKPSRPAILLSLLLAACGAGPAPTPTPPPAFVDPFPWLEEVEGERALAWARSHNDKTTGLLKADARYAKVEADAGAILLARDRIPMPEMLGPWVYNHWRDEKNRRGLWRRATRESYDSDAPAWETILDVDALAEAEKENWVWKGGSSLPPAGDRALVRLSRGGKDAVVLREFDIPSKSFVKGGFELPEAKLDAAWKDADTLLVGTDFGPGSLTSSGYPRLVKLWKRGTPLADAKTIFEGQVSDVSCSGSTWFTPDGNLTVIERGISFWEQDLNILEADGSLRPLPLPRDCRVVEYFKGSILAVLRTPLTRGQVSATAGTLVAFSPADATFTVVMKPDDRSSVREVRATRDALYISILQNVDGRLLRATKSAQGWDLAPVALPVFGWVGIAATDPYEPRGYATFSGALQPTTLYAIDGIEVKKAKQLPEKFDAKDLEVRQFEAKSADGTMIPYFVMSKKDLALDGNHPTILYGYGGFEIPMTPSYNAHLGKVWLEAGNVYVLANIRGGGEFGPAWHAAALKEKRQKCFDDFIGIAEDLVKRRITSPRRLGIMGGSNGGLLVGATFVQRPDLFNAVLCQVPLLDMKRYTKLLAGASWIGEYGDPEDPAMWAAISRYSPYQNVKAGVKYPRVFFSTSTKDDRVHPGHARKMAALMEQQGHEILYFENIEGGHGAAANIDQQVRKAALEYVYFFRQLAD